MESRASPSESSANVVLIQTPNAHGRSDSIGAPRQPKFFESVWTPLRAAFVASIAYVDPGNFATNVQGGSEFGYTLLWVVLLANLMAMLFQLLSAKLGIASNMDLGRCCRETLPTYVNIPLWMIAEIAAIATDIAEFVGAAIGFKILFGIPLIWGGVLTATTTFTILLVRDSAMRVFEVVVMAFIGVIVMCFVIETIIGSVDWSQVGYHLFVPQLEGSSAALLAVGIVGATVMPHAIYLHSALTIDRKLIPDVMVNVKLAYRYELTAIIIALGLAGFVNMGVLTMAASGFHDNGHTEVATIEDAYELLGTVVGRAGSYAFAIGLIASGISSSAIGTLAGQIVMEGFLDYKISVWVRRMITLVPSLAVIVSGVEPTKALVFSQVVLSFCIPFALVPLVVFTSNKRIVGEEWKNRRVTIAFATLFTTIIVGMNMYLIYATIKG